MWTWSLLPKPSRAHLLAPHSPPRTGAYFWDWSSVQGGECGANKWALEGLGNKDHVHMTEAGYEQSADRLFDDLMRAVGQQR